MKYKAYQPTAEPIFMYQTAALNDYPVNITTSCDQQDNLPAVASFIYQN